MKENEIKKDNIIENANVAEEENRKNQLSDDELEEVAGGGQLKDWLLEKLLGNETIKSGETNRC